MSPERKPDVAGPQAVTAPGRATERRFKRASKPEDKDMRRAVILAAAKKIFAKKGYHGTTVADVAREAELSYGSIYWYFDSKDALFHALMELGERELRDRIRLALQMLPPTASAVELFKAAVAATFEFFESDKDVVRLIFRDAYSLGPGFESHLYRIYENFIRDIEQGVAKAQEMGEIIPANPRVVAFSIAALIGQIALRRLVTNDGVSAREIADFVVNLILYGLVPRKRTDLHGRGHGGNEPGEQEQGRGAREKE
jgi:AcrR family transcriptional regulator